MAIQFNDQLLWDRFKPFWDELDAEDFSKVMPLLAHYTSVGTVEKILSGNEIWFSNPLYMNDHEEVSFGILAGIKAARESSDLKLALTANGSVEEFFKAFGHFSDLFSNHDIKDTYVLSMSRHDPDDNDGLLSMWRGYGGNGSGAALVIDTSKMATREDSPLILAKVHYASRQQRVQWIREKVSQFAVLLAKANLPLEKMYIAAAALFERIKLFSIFSKHTGFQEEKEWRAVYIPSRDRQGKLKHLCHYAVGPRGIEPKLKFRFSHIKDVTTEDFSLEKILDRILLGPTISSPLAIAAFLRMLEANKRESLRGRVRASEIPLREKP